MSHAYDPRDANLLGALGLAVADRLAGSSTAEALVELHGRRAGSTIEALSGVTGLTHSGAVRLIDRLAELLERSDLSELEVESGGIGLILRKPVLVAAAAPAATGVAAVASAPATETTPTAGEPSTAGRDPALIGRPSVKAPLTWPKSSLSRRCTDMPPALMATNGPSLRWLEP